MHYKDSYKFGKEQELRVLPVLIEYFKKDIKPYLAQYDKHDLFSDDWNFEVKSRKVSLACYRDTMITMNKLVGEKPLVLVFNFTDCITYIHYEEELFKTFRTELFGREGSEEKQHVFIPIDKLILIKKW